MSREQEFQEWGFNPSEKYHIVNLYHFPKNRGENVKKWLKFHHLDNHHYKNGYDFIPYTINHQTFQVPKIEESSPI